MEEIKKQKCAARLRAVASLTFWSWILIYPLVTNIFDVHIMYHTPLADVALFLGLSAIILPFYLYFRTIFRSTPQGSSDFFRTRNILITTIVLISIFATTDYILVKQLKHPLFAVYVDSYKDGGTAIYFGTGYSLLSYHTGITPKLLRGPKLYILYMPVLSIDGSFYVAE